MIVVDANLLIYAVNRDAPDHKVAKRWLERALNGSQTTGFSWTVLLAFLRLSTRRGVFEKPLNADRAMAIVNEWLACPPSAILNPGERHWQIFRNLIDIAGTAGNLTSAAHLAAIALENGAALYSADHDFRRFPGLKFVNPLTHAAK